MLNSIIDFITGTRGSSQTRLVVLVTAALTVIGVTIFAAQPWGGGNTAQAEDPPRICDFFPDYFLCEPTETLTPSNTPTITNTPTHTLTPTNTLTPTLTPTFIPKLTSTAPPKAIIGGGTGGEVFAGGGTDYMPMFNSGLYPQVDKGAAQQAMPSDGTVTHFFVRTDQAVGSSVTVAVRKNSSDASTPFCRVLPGETSCENRSRCITFAAGDLIDISISGSELPAPRAFSWTAVFTPNAVCPLAP